MPGDDVTADDRSADDVPASGVPAGEAADGEVADGEMADEGAVWRTRRRDAAVEHAEALARRQAGQARQARALIADFVREATAQGVPTSALQARSYDGRARFRTPLRGWYLRRNESVAVGTDGEFYILTVPGGLRARLRGATPVASDPPLILGKGGRDGESIDLVDALARALAGQD